MWAHYGLAVLLLISPLLVHEAGHWAMLRKRRVAVKAFWLGLGPVLFRRGRFCVGLFPIGAAVVPEEHAFTQLRPRQKLEIALAGPMASLLYALVLFAISASNPTLPGVQGLYLLGWLNLGIAVLNLLPIPPLDGFQALVHWRAGRGTPYSEKFLAKANRLGHGVVFGVGFMILGMASLRML
jgi:membrane-associated protease RseP (regulator of RpoE activity)